MGNNNNNRAVRGGGGIKELTRNLWRTKEFGKKKNLESTLGSNRPTCTRYRWAPNLLKSVAFAVAWRQRVGAQPCCGAGSGSVCHGALARPRLHTSAVGWFFLSAERTLRILVPTYTEHLCTPSTGPLLSSTFLYNKVLLSQSASFLKMPPPPPPPPHTHTLSPSYLRTPARPFVYLPLLPCARIIHCGAQRGGGRGSSLRGGERTPASRSAPCAKASCCASAAPKP
jgi:hypothetical protein